MRFKPFSWHLAYYVSAVTGNEHKITHYSEIQLFNSWIASLDAERVEAGIPSIFD